MVDADVVGSKLPNGQTRHWLVNGVTVSGSTVANSSAIGITVYAGPAPAAGSGPHRYVVTLYSQPSTFTPPAAFSQPNMGVSTFDFNAYVKDSGLGPLVAATYFTVEEGTATASIPPTSAVVTSTLVATSSKASSSGSATGSGAAPSATTHSGASSLASRFSGITAAAGLALIMVFI
ncbi:phosphatidylethanolamine-binding protein [Flammula alnicola]|nr:phosphatidylethanolamine-binding protein [Flammula alnicola]